MNLSPVLLKPRFVPRIWGSRSLAPLFPEQNSLAEPVGEAWLTGDDCLFATGPFTGQKLGDVWPRLPDEWIGDSAQLHSRGNSFPLLAKFIFPEEKLSVQVHPHDDFAGDHEKAAGGIGKTEMWYVVLARPGAEVRVGLKPHVTPEVFRGAIAAGTAEDCIERVPVRAGDAIFVPAGTVHAIGPGVLLCEIQQNSDLTYRIFDYNRRTSDGKSRELHVEKALQVVRFGEQKGGKVRPTIKKDPKSGSETSALVECSYFTVAKTVLAPGGRWMRAGRRFEVMIVLDGPGKISYDGGSTDFAPGQAWLIPAAVPALHFISEKSATILHAGLPESSRS